MPLADLTSVFMANLKFMSFCIRDQTLDDASQVGKVVTWG
jgi:hypothetical protein